MDKYESNGEENSVITVGICAMNKKTSSRPMLEILQRLQRFELLNFIVFPDEVILNQPVQTWPAVDCLIAFYSTGFPLQKAIDYVHLRQPFLLNDLETQCCLHDRQEVYRILETNGVEVPRYAVFHRNSENMPVTGLHEIEESDDIIIVNGKTFKKPFVEKPVDAENHDIYIYYPSSAGGGCQLLFRKIGNRSSVYSSRSMVRRQGSFIYEDFMHTDGTDVKVYTIGSEYAHAEARKSPALDGIVDRDGAGKEIRYPVILSASEKLVAKKVAKAFKQTVCGFDLLRAGGQSLVCDVNGFSFVKTSQKYYDDCSQLLADIILKNLAPQFWQPSVSPALDFQAEELKPFYEPDLDMELRCVVGIMRHGDRTPKQKMKMVVHHRLFFDLYQKYDGDTEGCLKLKKPKHLSEVLDVVRKLIDCYGDPSLQPIYEKYNRLVQMRNVLEMYGHFDGINRKVQIKSMDDKRNSVFAKLSGRNELETRTKSTPGLLVIVKWGGELTPMGKNQAECLGRAFRRLYQAGEGKYGRVPGCGLLRLHSTYRHDLKIYASDEGRVQMTAAAFAKGLLALEGELTPVLVSLVKSDKYVTNMLDTANEVNGTMFRVKSRLHNYLHSSADFTKEDIQSLAADNNISIARAMTKVRNPLTACEEVYALILKLTKQINEKCAQQSDYVLYHHESIKLMKHRWEKLKKDFKNGIEFDISLIPDIYDGAKYDYLHNSRLGLSGMRELYIRSKALADIVIPQEYGITGNEKLKISKELCENLMKKIRADLQFNVNQLNECVHRLDPSESSGVENPHQHVRTRLYFTSESHVHSIINSLKHGILSKSLCDEQWRNALRRLNEADELNYLTQIVFMQYENLHVDPTSEDRFRIEIFFSPGVKNPVTVEISKQLQEESLGHSFDFAVKKSVEDSITLKNKTQEREAQNAELLGRKFSKFGLRSMSMDGFDMLPSKKLSLTCFGSPPNSYFLTNKTAFVDEAVNIRGADEIETLPSLHPMVSLHSSVSHVQMDEFLNDMKSERSKSLSDSVTLISENETHVKSGLGYVSDRLSIT